MTHSAPALSLGAVSFAYDSPTSVAACAQAVGKLAAPVNSYTKRSQTVTLSPPDANRVTFEMTLIHHKYPDEFVRAVARGSIQATGDDTCRVTGSVRLGTEELLWPIGFVVFFGVGFLFMIAWLDGVPAFVYVMWLGIMAGFVALAVTEVNKLLRARDQLLADIASTALGTPRQTIL